MQWLREMLARSWRHSSERERSRSAGLSTLPNDLICFRDLQKSLRVPSSVSKRQCPAWAGVIRVKGPERQASIRQRSVYARGIAEGSQNIRADGSGMPRKRLYRQRAHANPFSDHALD